MNADPAVRSIRVASSLNDRFGMILREVGGNLRVAELELRIGEAQQIYPEIWRHLDDARAVLRERCHVHGGALSEFDALRATERPGELAVRNIEGAAMNSVPLAMGGMQYLQGKTATFNARGHAKARDACSALMRALPGVDWNRLAQEEARQIAEAGSLRTTRWEYAILGLIVMFVIFAIKSCA